MALWQNFRLGEGIYGDSLMLDRSDLNSDILGMALCGSLLLYIDNFQKSS